MADIQRSLNDLLTVQFPDGLTAGSITAQTMRDLIVSLISSHVAMYITGGALTTIGVAGTYVKAAGVTAVPPGFTPRTFTHTPSNRLTYDGIVVLHALVTASVSISAAGANKMVGLKLAKNGVVIDSTVVMTNLQTGGDISAVSVLAAVDLDPNDFLEMYVTNLTDTTDVTIESMYFHIQGAIA